MLFLIAVGAGERLHWSPEGIATKATNFPVGLADAVVRHRLRRPWRAHLGDSRACTAADVARSVRACSHPRRAEASARRCHRGHRLLGPAERHLCQASPG